MSKDSLGDRMKRLERQETDRRFLFSLPIYARIDGRGFSKFTRDMERPYDTRMTTSMIETTRTLVEKTQATLGYVQSDEISLVWVPTGNGHGWFDGKVTKMTSVLAGLATAAFIENVIHYFPNWQQLVMRLPHFDARVISMPSLSETANMLLWRNLDASKNSVSMAAHHYRSHKELQGLDQKQQQELLWQSGINWNDFPAAFKRGTWVRRRVVQRTLNESELGLIPEHYRPDPGTLFTRSEVQSYDLPPLNRIINRVAVLFEDAPPEYKEADK